MKRILLFLFCLGSFLASNAQYPPTNLKQKFSQGLGLGSKDSTAFNANDSLVASIDRNGRMIFRGNGVNAPFRVVLPTSDTASMLSPYFRKTDTTGLLSNVVRTFGNQTINDLKSFKFGVSLGTRDSTAYNAADSLAVVINRQGRMMYRSTDGYWKVLANGSFSGTTNTVPKFTSVNGLGNSNITDDGSLISLNSNTRFNGKLAINTPISSTSNFVIRGTIAGGLDATGIQILDTIKAGVNNAANISSLMTIEAGATAQTALHFAAGQIPLSGTILQQTGFSVGASLAGAWENFGFRSQMPYSPNNFALYMGGTANNLLNGRTLFGTFIDNGFDRAQIDGGVRATGQAVFATNSGTNLGVGLTPSAWGATALGGTSKVVEFGQLGSFIGAGTNGLFVGNNWYSDGTTRYARSSFPATQLQFNGFSGEFRFLTAPSGTAGNPITFSSEMTLTNNSGLLVTRGITTQRGRFSSLVVNKDSLPITTANFWAAMIDTTGGAASRINRRNLSAVHTGAIAFDTTTRQLTVTQLNGGTTSVIIPRGGSGGGSGITALSSSRTGNLVTVSGDNGSSTIFSVRDADSSSPLASLTPSYGIVGSAYNGGTSQTWAIDTSQVSTKANVTASLLGYLPLTGGTVSGALAANSLTVTNDIATTTGQIFINSNNKFLNGRSSDNLFDRKLIGLNASNIISVDPDAVGAQIGGSSGFGVTNGEAFFNANNKFLHGRTSDNLFDRKIIGLNSLDSISIDLEGLGTVFGGGVRATSFKGSGSNLTSLPTNTSLYPTLNQSTTGNAATSTLSANSTLWNGLTYRDTLLPVPTFILTSLGDAVYKYSSLPQVMTAAGAALLSGANFTGNVSTTGTLKGSGFIQPISLKTANYTLTTNDHTVVFDCASANRTVTLPVGVEGQIFVIKAKNASTNAAIITPNGSQTIEGNSTYSLQNTCGDAAITIQFFSGNWEIISSYIPPCL